MKRAKRTASGSEGASERKRGLPTLCESGRERSEFCGGQKRWHGQARTGTQIYLQGGLAVAVFPPHLIAVALLLGKGLACYL